MLLKYFLNWEHIGAEVNWVDLIDFVEFQGKINTCPLSVEKLI